MAGITRTKIENTSERMIVTGMVVSADYMARIINTFKPEYLAADFARVVSGWCVDYYKKFNKAPGVHIKDIFDRNKNDSTIEEDTIDLIESFLGGLSEEFERSKSFNVDFIVKETEAYFRKQSLLKVFEDGRIMLERGAPPEDAEVLIAEYKSPLLTATQSVSVFDNPEWWGEEEEDVQELFRYPGPLGEVIGAVERDSFIAFLAPEKRGKCIRGDQMIAMADGSFKQMVDVIKDKDTTVLGLDTRSLKIVPVSVVDHVCNGKKHCYRLTTKTGRSVVVTDNEPFYTPKGWVELRYLGKGDRIAVAKNYAQTKSETAKKCVESDIVWDYVASISYEGEFETYDLSVADHHNYIASGVVVHNTWCLLDLSMRGIRNGCNVAFWSVGDLTEKQMRARLRTMLTGKSARIRNKKSIIVPVLDCIHNQCQDCPIDRAPDNDPIMAPVEKGKKRKKEDTKSDWTPSRFLDAFPSHEPCIRCSRSKDFETKKQFKGTPWWNEVTVADIPLHPVGEGINKIKRRGGGRFEMWVRPAHTVTVEDIDKALTIFYHQNGVVFDIIVVDYPDILKASNGRLEYRHQENEKWMALRALSQKWNAAVVVATQARRNDKESMDTDEMAEDKRKMAHVTSFIALNQTKEEKRKGILRMAQFISRDDDFDSARNAHILQAIPLGKPVITSYW